MSCKSALLLKLSLSPYNDVIVCKQYTVEARLPNNIFGLEKAKRMNHLYSK